MCIYNLLSIVASVHPDAIMGDLPSETSVLDG